MKDAKDVLRIVGMILLGVFVFTVGVPLVLKVAGITLGIISILIGLAVFFAIKQHSFHPVSRAFQ